MSTKSLFVVVIVAIVLSVLLVGCGGSSPQPVCPTEGGWVGLADSVTANNPTGVCQDANGNVMAGLQSFADYFAEAAKKAEQVGTCYNNTGMGTTCVAAQVGQ
jgi:hypothetical protein